MFPFRLCCFTVCMMVMLIACKHRPPIVIPSWYYWKTNTSIDDEEKQRIRNLHAPFLYAKVLDIDWAGVNEAIPVAQMDIHDLDRNLNHYDSLHIRIIPVVFITNKTFSKIDSAGIPVLAKRILRRCLPAYDSMDIDYETRQWDIGPNKARPREIQFDCDWTQSTAGKYFYFLETVRRLLPQDSIRISATIRLHQYKYKEKTGVPPVDRGMLMVYNVNDLKQYSPVNSIFEMDKAEAYIKNTGAYSLPLDIALPAYSWGLVFRNGKFYQIKNHLDDEQLAANGGFQSEGKQSNGVCFYRVLKDTVMDDLFLRPGDEIKIESIDTAQLAEAAALARRATNTDSFRVALFDLSSTELKRFRDETITNIFHSFH